MTVREGNLEAPTRHPVAWRAPEFFEEAKSRRNGAGVQHLSRLPALVNLCTAFPTLFDLVDASATLEVDGVEKFAVLEGRRPVLPLRHVLHDENARMIPPHPLGRGFPAPDAAGQGRSSSGKGK